MTSEITTNPEIYYSNSEDNSISEDSEE